MADESQSFEFQAEARQLLDIVIHSLYTDKEIFLRELISNASDALDRLRFEALTDPDLIGKSEKLEIRIIGDKEDRTLTIHDNGIGMSREEAVQNLGTIAKSGTKELVDQIKKAKSSEIAEKLIGQFGVGFYSTFMVSDQVEVVTRRAGQKKACRWVSQGDGSFNVEDDSRSERGTSITLHLKPVDKDLGLEDFTDPWTISRLVKRYSDFVTYPIINKEVKEEPEKDKDGNPVKDGKKVITYEDKTLNSMKPIWKRPADDVTEEEFQEFYKHISHDWEKPLRRFHFKAEGLHEYQALLFIPSKAPNDIHYHAHEYGLRLYARQVNIMERCSDLIPRCFRFLRGIVDSSDLPLNISRQRLQNDRHIVQIRKWLTKKTLEALNDLRKKDEEAYLKFWKEFGATFKEAVTSEWENKDKVLPLLLFPSSNDPEKLTTLEEYVQRMPEGQHDIYHLSGETRQMLDNSPHLEAFKEKGYEVVFMTDPVDEIMLQSMPDFRSRRLKSAAKGALELEEEKDNKKAARKWKKREKRYRKLFNFLRKALDEKIKDVRLSRRLTSSPVCLVGTEMDYSPSFERMLEQARVENPKQRRIMELNPNHPVVRGMLERFEKDSEDPILNDYAQLLLGCGLLAEGGEIPDTSRFNSLIANLMVTSMPEAVAASEAGPEEEMADDEADEEEEAVEAKAEDAAPEEAQEKPEKPQPKPKKAKAKAKAKVKAKAKPKQSAKKPAKKEKPEPVAK